MKKPFIIILLTTLAVSCGSSGTLTQDEVLAVISKFDEGWENKNGELVDSVIASNYIYYTQSGGIFERDKLVQTANSPEYKLDVMQRKIFEIKIDGNTAVVNTVWYGKGRYYDKPFNDRQRCSITLIKRNGKVMIMSEQCTPIK